MLFGSPIPFREALQRQETKSILPTVLSSDELSKVNPALLERGMFSARVVNADFLQQIDDVLTGILQGKTSAELPAMDVPTARLSLKNFLRSIGYTPAADEVGSIKDL